MRGGRCLSSDAPAAPLRAGNFVLGGGVALACGASIARRKHGVRLRTAPSERAQRQSLLLVVYRVLKRTNGGVAAGSLVLEFV